MGRRARGRLALGAITRLPRKPMGPRVPPSRPNATTETLWVTSLLGVVPKVGNPRCYSTKGVRERGWVRPGRPPRETGAQAWSSG